MHSYKVMDLQDKMKQNLKVAKDCCEMKRSLRKVVSDAAVEKRELVSKLMEAEDCTFSLLKI